MKNQHINYNSYLFTCRESAFVFLNLVAMFAKAKAVPYENLPQQNKAIVLYEQFAAKLN